MSFVGLLTPAECERLASVCEQFESSKPMIVGEEYAPERRQGAMRRLPPGSETKWIYDLILDAGSAANERYFFLSLTGIVKEPEYVEYRPGNGRFDWHNDYGQEQPISRRKLTISVQLSDPSEYDGGALEIFDAERSVLPRELGSVTVFPSFYYHRVTPVTRGKRRALVAWLAGQPLT